MVSPGKTHSPELGARTRNRGGRAKRGGAELRGEKGSEAVGQGGAGWSRVESGYLGRCEYT